MGRKCRLIACEVAWTIPEVAEELRLVSREPSQSSDKMLVGGIYDADHDTELAALSKDRMSIENVIWAIDCPYQPMKPAVDFIENFACTEAEMHALCHGNAEGVFRIAVE